MSTQVFILLHILAVLLIASVALSLYIFSVRKGFAKKKKWLIIGAVCGGLFAIFIALSAVFWGRVTQNVGDGGASSEYSIIVAIVVAVALIIFGVLLAVIIKLRKGKRQEAFENEDADLENSLDNKLETKKDSFFSSKNITRMAIFTAIALVLYLIAPFSVPVLFPGFLSFNFSDIPVLLAGFMMGPIAGVIVLVSKILLKLPFSSTAGVGELGDLMFGLAFMLPATIIYMFRKNKKGALIGLSVGVLTSLGVAILANRFILVPFYANILFGGLENLINITGLNGLYPNMTADNFFRYYILFAVIPFNLIRLLISAAVTFFLYKHLSRASKHLFG